MDDIDLTSKQGQNIDKGYIALFRSIQDHWLWSDKPFARGQAFIDLLLLANHKDGKVFQDGKLKKVKRGEKITSIRQLSERWGWSRHKVSDFLDLLESEQMLSVKRDSKKTVYKLVNYELYNEPGIRKRATQGQHRDNTGTTQGHHKDTNNHDKPCKPCKPWKPDIYSRAVSYLNEKAGRDFKPTTPKTKSLIDARLNEGFELQDFKTVIDKKTAEWLGDEKMDKYLRPETLFGTKFESYLNEKPKQQFSKQQQKQEQPKDPYDDGNDIMDQLNEYYRNLERQEANG